MPVEFEEYDPKIHEDVTATNENQILVFLAQHPAKGFTPKEIHDATGIPRGSIGTTLKRMKEKGLVRHKEPYWSVADNERTSDYLATLKSVKALDERLGVEDKAFWKENAVDPREGRDKDGE
ncbi:MAG: helix-turn-helix domain-containing protein [Halobacteria archaeon]|nr:helix-turn-helix domain-containing protein [Halobacteria archaeon]